MQNLTMTDQKAIETAFAGFPSGVAALTALVDGVPTGLVATSFTVGISFDPPLVLFSVRNSSTTWPVLRRAVRIGVSVLGSEHEAACMQLASRDRDRFAGLATETTADGAIFLHDSVMWLDCHISVEIPAGDHSVIVLAVQSVKHAAGVEPLIYHSRTFRKLVTEAADLAA
ncbi:flavin reductase (DIM6/NTAB) family NADH-FMN oxidoreductase RutF [Glaciihabitans tibetensis]|uniref:Flavin reductase (DIM6/NTAB) family NADH-FMN oxidoreductase RutF n=1 Tax=Glaciihabitans tibetensis TaxID=1266600 RepID=A0A2T0VDV2_9MICO|nr:flavin reductase family protein [Glaciihabitans tibetensis]PRY68355.1 flavin reductase (DIM6/NTAB) family NADH-FMN oxidoreductase RutF [Glaciihabitans tibetensis]